MKGTQEAVRNRSIMKALLGLILRYFALPKILFAYLYLFNTCNLHLISL